MKRLVFFLISLFPFIQNFAQNSIDLLTIAGHYSFPREYESDLTEKGKEHIWHMNMKLPLVLSGVNTWYSEISYLNFRVNGNENVPVDRAQSVNLHGVIMQTGLIHRLNEDKALILLFVPRLMGDFENLNGENFQYGGMALYEKRFHKALTMRFGVSYNQELFGPFVVPLVYLNWQLSEKWNIAGLLPIYGKVNYRVNDDLTAGLHYFGLVTTYRLGNDLFAEDYIERRSIDLSFFGRYRIAGNLHAEIRTGIALGRDYRQYAGNDRVDFALPLINFGDDRVQQNISFNGGPFIRGQLVYNLVLEKKN